MNIKLLLLLFSIFSAVALVQLGAAQSGYSIINPAVTPEYGYEEFTYSAQVAMSSEASSRVGEIAVTKYYMELRIYNEGELLGTFPSETNTGMKTSIFEFGPYNFQNRFGIKETENATFEFAFYANGNQVAKTAKIKGPIIKPPSLTGINYEKKPYFFQGIVVSAGFKDQESLSPLPTCHLEVTGPLGSTQSRTWTTSDTSCKASGKSSYICSITEDLSSYKEGGNFSFLLIYNNLKSDPLTFGPYDVSLQPYSPSVDKLTVPKQLDYTNFTIEAYVKDAGAKIVGGFADGSLATLVISHPQKGDISYSSSEPAVQGSSLVYRWTQDNVPPLFNRSDVQLSKISPFSAKIVYRNENWNYQAEKSNVSFKVIEEVPKIDLQYPSIVYVRSGEKNSQDIAATVTFSKGSGDMEMSLVGPGQSINSTLKPVALGGNKYQFKSQITFDERHVNNNYTLSLSFVNPSLEGGKYTFEDKRIEVVPVSVQFLDAQVSSDLGLWNDSYTYSVLVNTTVVPLDVSLQTYDPCSTEWTDKESQKAETESSLLSWSLSPFDYECDEMQEQGAKYRFKATFSGKDYYSKAYVGPKFKSETSSTVTLVSLDSEPVVYISKGSETSSAISAVVQYAGGKGQAILHLTGPDKDIEETDSGTALGDNKYRYEWSPSFSDKDAGKSFNYTLVFRHASLEDDVNLTDGTKEAKLISISFSEDSVLPASGKWNDSFTFSAKASSSVDARVILEVYNPCSREWEERASGTLKSGVGQVNLTAQPLPSKCEKAEGSEVDHRFVAIYSGNRIASEVYPGPKISGGKIELLSLDYTPTLYVSDDVPEYQLVKAIVDSPAGQDTMEMSITGPNKNIVKEASGVYLGGTQYMYTWIEPFRLENVGKHTITVRNLHPETRGGEISSANQMEVVSTNTSATTEPSAVGDVNYQPVLFVSEEKAASQSFSAEVFSPAGQGSMMLKLSGEDKEIEVNMGVTDLGDGLYRYEYAEPFDISNSGKIYEFSLDYELDGKSYALFNDHVMQVALEGTQPEPIWEPKLVLDYDTTLYVPVGGQADQLIYATINYSRSGGTIKLNLYGPNKNYSEDLKDKAIGANKYLYEAKIPFNDSHVDNSYTIALAFNHSDLPGGNYRFADHYMRVLRKSPITKTGDSGSGAGAQTNRVFDDSNVTVIGSVSPEVGVIQSWDEKDSLHALTYTLKLENWTSEQAPYVELWVKPAGSEWKKAGDERRYNFAAGNVSWTLKPFWEAPFLGVAEYRFLIDGAETKSFEGPEIIAVISDASDSISGSLHYFKATVNASENATVCLMGGDNSLAENVKNWTVVGRCQDYSPAEGDKPFSWQTSNSLAPLYYDFDVQPKEEAIAQ